MNNMKKALALVLSMALAASTLVAGAAYSDVSATHSNAAAINLLGDLGVMVGDAETGNFRPEGTLSRSEAAAIVFRMRAGKTNADNYAGNTKFSDVPSAHWAAGYINYAETTGIINGYPDGSFKPDQKVTYAEFTKMVVSALNLQEVKTIDKIDMTTGLSTSTKVVTTAYPNGYIAIADEQGINDGISLSQDDPADRAAVAQISYNAIFEADYVKVLGGDRKVEQTLATEIFKINSEIGVVTAIGGNSVDGNKVDSKYITVGGDDYKYESMDPTLLGQKVKVYIKDATTTESSKVVAVVPHKDSATSTVKVADLKKDGDKRYFVNAAGDKQYIDSVGKVVVNGVLTTLTQADIFAMAEDSAPASITFVDNNDSKKSAEYTMVTLYASAKIDTVESKYIYLNDVKGMYDSVNGAEYVKALNEIKLTDEASKKIVRVEDDGKVNNKLSLYDGVAVKDDVVVSIDGNGKISILKAEKLEGTISGQSGSTFTIGGKEYKTTTTDNKDTLSNAVGNVAEIKVDPVFGYIYAVDTAVAAVGDYYYIDGVKFDDTLGSKTFKAIVFDSQGVKKELEIKNELVGGKNLVDVVANMATISSTTTATLTGDKNNTNMVATLRVNSKQQITECTPVIKTTVASDTLLGVLTPTTDATAGTNTDMGTLTSKDYYNATTKVISGTAVSGKTNASSVIFAVKADPTTPSMAKEVKAYIGQFPTIKSASGKDLYLAKKSASDSTVKVGVVYGEASGTSSVNSGVFNYVTSVNKVVTDKDSAYVEYKMIVNGEEVTVATETDSLSVINKLDIAKHEYMTYDLNSEGKIILDSIDQTAFVSVYAANSDEVYTGKVLKSSDNTVEIKDASGTSVNILEVASNAQIIIIDDNGDARRATSIPESTTTVNRIANYVVDKDERVTKIIISSANATIATAGTITLADYKTGTANTAVAAQQDIDFAAGAAGDRANTYRITATYVSGSANVTGATIKVTDGTATVAADGTVASDAKLDVTILGTTLVDTNYADIKITATPTVGGATITKTVRVTIGA